MARLYHPNLGVEIDVADDEQVIAIHAASGWLPAPTPEQVPGFEPEPVTYAPVEKPAKAKSTTKK